MAVFQIYDNAGIGSTVTSTFNALPISPTQLISDDGSVAIFRAPPGFNFDTFAVKYENINGVNGILDGVAYFRGGEVIQFGDNLNIQTTLAIFYSPTGTVVSNLNAQNDEMYGNAFPDTLWGGFGDDRLYGNGGNDMLAGEAGGDGLYGGDGADYIDGGLEGDYIIGSLGPDTLYGGSGGDVFAFGHNDTGLRALRDRIGDFSNEDLLDLEAIDANTKKGGDQDFKFIGAEKFSGTAGELRYVKGVLSGDINGDGKADGAIIFSNKVKLTADLIDF